MVVVQGVGKGEIREPPGSQFFNTISQAKSGYLQELARYENSATNAAMQDIFSPT